MTVITRLLPRQVNQFFSGKTGRAAAVTMLLFASLRLGDAAMFFSRIFLGRYLPPLFFGAIDPFFSVLAVITLPVQIAGIILIRTISSAAEQNDNETIRSSIFSTLVFAAMISIFFLGFVLVFQSYILSRLHLQSSVYIVILAATAALSAWPILFSSILQGLKRFAFISALAVGQPMVSAGLILFFTVYLKLQLPGVLSARFAAELLAVFAAFVVVIPLLKGAKFQLKMPYSIKTILVKPSAWLRNDIVPVSIFIISSSVLLHFDRLFVRNYLTAFSGGYGAILSLGQIPLYLASPVKMVLFPIASAQHASGTSLDHAMRKMLLAGIAGTVCCFIFFHFAGGLILSFWRAEFISFAAGLTLYSLNMCVEVVLQLAGHIQIARRRYNGFFLMSAVIFIVCTLLYYFSASIDISRLLVVMLITRIVCAGILFTETPLCLSALTGKLRGLLR